jgi:protein-tyrosine-phosphatase
VRASSRTSLLVGFLLGAVALYGQKEQRQPLTEPEIEQIREAGIDPLERAKLYTKFLDEHVDTIKGLTNRAHSAARTKRMDSELLDLIALMDEFGSNLDQYGERKADLRKSLKPLTEATQRWLKVLNAIPTESGFDLSRKEAIDSGKDLADEAEQMLKEQTDYFNLHKDEKGQERAEPK